MLVHKWVPSGESKQAALVGLRIALVVFVLVSLTSVAHAFLGNCNDYTNAAIAYVPDAVAQLTWDECTYLEDSICVDCYARTAGDTQNDPEDWIHCAEEVDPYSLGGCRRYETQEEKMNELDNRIRHRTQ